MKALNKGFTLVELMIVVAIIGILATIAVPAYSSYSARAQVTEALSIVGNAQLAINESYSNSGQWPADNTAAGLAAAADIDSKYVESVQVTDNVITVTFRNGAPAAGGIQGKTLLLTAGTSAAGIVNWQCGSMAEPSGVTAGTTPFATAGAGGTLAQKDRPVDCRG